MPDLEILSPQPFQVIQRRGVLPLRHPGERADLSNGWAPVEIRARTSLAGELTLRLTVTPIGADPTGFSLTPTRSGGAGSFGTTVTDGLIRHTVSMPAGGWYALALAATAADGATATAHAGPFGIGELYLIGGQSHSNNWNDSLKTIADPAGRVTALDLHSGDWRIAHDPQPFNDSLAPMDAAAAGQFRAVLWHQGEEDAGDNGDKYHADYCTYLVADVSALVTFLRAAFPGGSNSTPFVNGGLLPYWQDAVAGGTGGVPAAIAALNTSRACTATADSRVFADYKPDGSPNGDPNARSGVSNDVIHFDATQNVFLGFEYWRAFLRATALTAPVPSAQTAGCPGADVQTPVAACGKA